MTRLLSLRHLWPLLAFGAVAWWARQVCGAECGRKLRMTKADAGRASWGSESERMNRHGG